MCHQLCVRCCAVEFVCAMLRGRGIELQVDSVAAAPALPRIQVQIQIQNILVTQTPDVVLITFLLDRRSDEEHAVDASWRGRCGAGGAHSCSGRL